MARNGRDKDYIKRYIELKYHYDFSKTLDEIRPHYNFDETCQGTVLTNPHTEKKTIQHPEINQSFVVPEYSETLFNFIRDAIGSPYFRTDYREILERHDIKQYGDMIVELPDASEVLLSAMLTLIISGERVNPGNVAWAAENGILGDIMQGLCNKQ